MSKIKCERIASDMIKIISNILSNESRDDLLKTVTVTGCTVSNDLSYAKVYFTSTSNLTNDQMEKEFVYEALLSWLETHGPESW